MTSPAIHEEPVPAVGDGVGNLRAHARMLGRVGCNAKGAPVTALTHPAAVCLHGYGSR